MSQGNTTPDHVVATLAALDEQISRDREQGHQHLPAHLLPAVERLRIASSLLVALGAIEGAAWDNLIYSSETRARALAFAAAAYDDLDPLLAEELEQHIRARAKHREQVLKELKTT
ncbi:hypothetical protein [Metapseudomonas otitidis]|uniref:hypothetical protein n=1 Tax=Metapseudomonas otitidis TaxID=319939 RepID=UPI000D198ADC|nr:hypothetical protein [Pseudomonas otitidis]